MLTLPCGSNGCRRCLKIFFRNATTDSGLWPLKCCKKDFDISLAKQVQKKADFKQLLFKKLQMESKSSMYCPIKKCSAWICLDNISSDTLSCHACKQEICTKCKQIDHGLTECKKAEDLVDKDLVNLMK